MADNNTAKVKIKIDDGGSIKATKKKMDGLSAATDKVIDKNKGVAATSGKAGKDFSRVASGMGGLVAAYATVAANVFALSAAYTVLKNAADFDSMVISANNLTAATGQSFIGLAKQMQVATGMQLTFAESLAATNKAVASGIDTTKLAEFTTLATKAAQTFGGTTTDSLNRMIDAVLRGRTELVNKMGIVISADEAYDNFSSSIGKTVQELTSFEKRQAITNAIIEEGNKVLGQTVIDPNPMEKLAVTFQDLAQDLLTLGTATEGFISKFVGLFNESKLAIGAFAAVMVSAIFKKLLPSQDELTKNLKKNVEKQKDFLSNLTDKQAALEVKKLQASAAYTEGLKENQKKRLKILATTIEKETDMELGKNKKLPLSFQAFMGGGNLGKREQTNLMKVLNNNINNFGEGSLKNLGLTKAQLKEVRTELRLLTGDTKHLSTKTVAELRKMGDAWDRLSVRTQQHLIAMERKALSFRTGMSASKLSVIEKGWTGLFSKLETNMSKIGQVAGRVAGGFNLLVGSLGTIMMVVGVASILWEKFGKELFGTPQHIENINKASEEGREALEEYLKTISDAESRLISFRENGLRGLAQEFNFLANAMEQSFGPIDKTIKAALNEIRKKKAELKDSEEPQLIAETRYRGSLKAGYSSQSHQRLENKAEVIKRIAKEVEEGNIHIQNTTDAMTTNVVASFDDMYASIAFMAESGFRTEEAMAIVQKQVDKSLKELKVPDGLGSSFGGMLGEALVDFSIPAPKIDMTSMETMKKSYLDAINKMEDSSRKIKLTALFKKGLVNGVQTVKGFAAAVAEGSKAVKEFEKEQKNTNTEFLSSKTLKSSVNALTTVNASLVTMEANMELLTETDHKNLKEWSESWNLKGESVKTLKTEVEALLNTIGNAEQSIRISKILESILSTSKDGLSTDLNIEDTYTRRLEILEQINKKEQDILTEKIKQKNADIDLQNIAIQKNMKDGKAKEGFEKVVAEDKKRLALFKAQLAVLNKKLGISKKDLKSQKEVNKEEDRRLKAVLATLTHKQKLADIENKLKPARAAEAILQDRAFKDATASNKLAKAQAKYDSLRVKNFKDLGYASKEAAEAKKLELARSIILLKNEQDITKELRDRDHLNNAKILEGRGQNLAAAGQTLLAEKDRYQNISDQSIANLTKGFVQGIRDGFGTFFDLIIEGEASTREVIREGFGAMGKSILSSMSNVFSDYFTNMVLSWFDIQNIEEESLAALRDIRDNTAIAANKDPSIYKEDLSKNPLTAVFDWFKSGFEKVKSLFESDTEKANKRFDSSFDNILKAPEAHNKEGDAYGSEYVAPKEDVSPVVRAIKEAQNSNISKDNSVWENNLLIAVQKQNMDNHAFSQQTAIWRQSLGEMLQTKLETINSTLHSFKGEVSGTEVKEYIPEEYPITWKDTSNIGMPKQIKETLETEGIEKGMSDSATASKALADETSVLGNLMQGNTSAVIQQIAQMIFGTAADAVNTTTQAATTVSLQGSMMSLIFAVQQNTMALGTSSVTQGGGDIFSSIFSLGANGGVMSTKGFTPLANGGYATQATPYMVGEGRKNEAVVPLPNNREIPVEIKDSKPSTTVVNNYDFTNADAASEARIRRMIEANGKATFGKVFNEIDRGGTYAKKSGRRR